VSWPRGRARDGGIDEIPLPARGPGATTDRTGGAPIADGAASGGGRLWLCGKHVVGPDPEAALTRVGATTIVCLNDRGELADRYPAYVEWLGTNRGTRAVWFPIPDLHAPPIEAVLPLLADLHARLDRGESVIVHCGAGIGRAGTLAACLLVSLGLGADDALAVVATNRPMAGPEAGSQRELVSELAARLAV
jgi:protein-tyrosine phosphatase